MERQGGAAPLTSALPGGLKAGEDGRGGTQLTSTWSETAPPAPADSNPSPPSTDFSPTPRTHHTPVACGEGLHGSDSAQQGQRAHVRKLVPVSFHDLQTELPEGFLPRSAPRDKKSTRDMCQPRGIRPCIGARCKGRRLAPRSSVVRTRI